jgi:hypothetical protein
MLSVEVNILKDLDLLNENRSLIHSGKLLRQLESGSDLNGWKELFVLLFDNYRMFSFIRVWVTSHEGYSGDD